MDKVIAKLVEVHGEGGLSPTREDWQAIFSVNGPLNILNLLKFHDTVLTERGQISGAEAYGNYSAGVGRVFARVGGRLIFFGPVRHAFALGESMAWDAAILTRYPTASALADMWLDADFLAAHGNRHMGVERSQVMVFEATD